MLRDEELNNLQLCSVEKRGKLKKDLKYREIIVLALKKCFR